MANNTIKSESRFPIKALTVSLVFTIVLFVVFGYLIWATYKNYKTTELANLRCRELNGIILHLDEVLTMSARMAAATGNMKWAARYRHFEPLLDEAIKEARQMAPETFMTEAAAMTDAANVNLVAMEKRSFRLIQAGNREAASALLSSEDYEKEKRLYRKGIEQISSGLDNRILSSVESHHRRSLFAVISVAVVVPVLSIIWLLVARALNNYIADLNRTEAALRESETRYRTLIAKMLNGFALHDIICDEDGRPCDYRFIEVNSAFEELTGLNAEAIVGKTVLEILPQTESYWIDNFGKVALTGESVQMENYSREFDKYFEVLAYNTRKGQFATVFTDRTDQRKMQDELLRAQKLDSIGILAGGIAHDFNNLLSIIMGNLDLVKDELRPGADISALLAETEKACFQAHQLTRQLITFSKGGAPVKDVGSIAALVKEIKKS